MVGPASQVTWVNTVVWILLVGAIVGALLGYAARLRSTGLPRPALTAALLLFAAVLLPGLLHPTSMFVGGIGGGAVGVPLLGYGRRVRPGRPQCLGQGRHAVHFSWPA